jgi:hypothetical protein
MEREERRKKECRHSLEGNRWLNGCRPPLTLRRFLNTDAYQFTLSLLKGQLDPPYLTIIVAYSFEGRFAGRAITIANMRL